MLDSLVEGNSVNLELGEGRYSWRVRAQHTSSQSAYFSRDLIIDQHPPFVPQLIYPPLGAQLNWEQDSLALHWEAQDQPIDGKLFPTADSIWLFEWVNGGIQERARFFILEDQPKRISLEDLILVPDKGDSLEYCWRVSSRDRAGHSRKSLESTFVIK